MAAKRPLAQLVYLGTSEALALNIPIVHTIYIYIYSHIIYYCVLQKNPFAIPSPNCIFKLVGGAAWRSSARARAAGGRCRGGPGAAAALQQSYTNYVNAKVLFDICCAFV